MENKRIGVIADTHLTRPTAELAQLLEGPFCGVEAILHTGDITEIGVLDAFAGKEIIAVCGNMDSPDVRARLPVKRIWETGKFKIGLIHGWGGKQGVEERIRGEFEGVDCLVYGHTHTPVFRQRDGVYFFNPGSFSGPDRSVGILELGEAISGRIVRL